MRLLWRVAHPFALFLFDRGSRLDDATHYSNAGLSVWHFRVSDPLVWKVGGRLITDASFVNRNAPRDSSSSNCATAGVSRHR